MRAAKRAQVAVVIPTKDCAETIGGVHGQAVAPLAHERIVDKVFALVEKVEDLGPKDEVAAVLPLPQIAHRRDLGNEAVVANVDDVVRRLRREDLMSPTELAGALAGHWAINVSGNWRVTFAFENEDAVLVDYQGYH